MPAESPIPANPQPKLRYREFVAIKREFGLSPRESAQIITARGHTNTVAAMLRDEKCPMGEEFRIAFLKKGRAGVERKWELTAELYEEVENPIVQAAEQSNRLLEWRGQVQAEKSQKKNKSGDSSPRRFSLFGSKK